VGDDQPGGHCASAGSCGVPRLMVQIVDCQDY
jgi:hypothetical protein